MKSKRFLVTTGLEEGWSDQDHLFLLGDWCYLHSKKDKLQKKDCFIQSYHWNSFEKFNIDYQYLQLLYEKTLLALAEQLNTLHHESYSLRYWRIIVGPWLFYFIHAVYDRWETLTNALKTNTFSGTIYLKIPDVLVVPNGMTDFIRMFLNDEWNHYIFQKILEFKGNPIPYKERSVRTSPARGTRTRAKNIFRKILNLPRNIVPNSLKSKVIFLDTKLSIKERISLSLKFRGFVENNIIPECRLTKSTSKKKSLCSY